MGARKRKSRRLADMNAAQPQQAWAPDLEPEWPPYEQWFPIVEDDDTRRVIQKIGEDTYGRIAEWAVVQMRFDGEGWRRVAVYDICHRKGMHVHLYDRSGVEFTQVPLRPVASYRDAEDCLGDAQDRVFRYWQENERRSDRGR